MTKFVVLDPSGEVAVLMNEPDDYIKWAQVDKPVVSIDAPGEGVTVIYNPHSSEKFNWQATRLLRERFTFENRVNGIAYVTGLNGGDIPAEVIATLQARHAARS
jgi:hypothetical protein